MKKILFLVASLVLAGLLVAPLRAQNHAEIGAFADYYHAPQTGINFTGVGGRLAINVAKPLQLEAEMNYDFDQVFTEGFHDTESSEVTFARSNLRALHGLFGFKLQTSGPVRFFVTAKGGFVNFRFDPRPPTFDTFASSVDNLRTDNVDAVFYPGAGVEGFLGPLGLRLEVGDEMYFVHGVHQGIRVTFGPVLRF